MTFYIIVYNHRHGQDAWPVFCNNPPDLDHEARDLDEFEPERNEWLESYGPFVSPEKTS